MAGLFEERLSPEPLSEPLHRRLVDLLRLYLFVGGMPEVVAQHAEHGDVRVVRTIQSEILRTYQLDFAKHAAPSDIPKLSLVWDSVPRHLARENRKFMFSAVRPGARARSYESAIAWLSDAGLILRAFRVDAPRRPLVAHADPSAFKVYLLDVGLLGAMVGLPPRSLTEGQRLFEEFGGALTENYVAQQLAGRGTGARLVYWASASRAEVDFLYEADDGVFPLEVKACVNPRSKSLRSYGQRYAPPVLSRASLMNLRQDGDVCNYPLYAVSRFPFLGR